MTRHRHAQEASGTATAPAVWIGARVRPAGFCLNTERARRDSTPGATRVIDPAVGAIYYWPPSGVIAIVNDDLGQTVPPPGMIRLGTVDGVDWPL